MGRIFISHSSHDNAAAEAIRDWLAAEGWQDVFLDLDPVAGLAPGQHWRDELRKAGEQCSAVIVLLSPTWAASKWCLTEFLFAAQLGKEIFPVLIAPCPFDDLPVELTATYQFADISTPEKVADGHERLRLGLQRAGLHPGAFPWPPKDDPHRPLFRGLRVLEEADAAIFFGRDTQITKALDAIRRLRDGAPERMLVILGASGSGKSCFLRAGLLARLQRDTERFLVLPTLRPGRAALTGPTGLQRSLGVEAPLSGERIVEHLAQLRAPVVEHLRQSSLRPTQREAAKPPTVVLPIDQAEELFVAGDDEAAEVVELITESVKLDPNLLILLTIRSDSFSLLQGHPLLSSIPRLPFDLPRLPAAALKEVIEGPTRLPGSGITIDADLTEQLIDDFTDADALPLLAFTLERLILDHGADGRLEKSEYLDQMKGVGGAIRKAVELAFAVAAEHPGLPRTRAELDALAKRSFVPWLVRIDDVAATPKRRIALRSQLPVEALPLIDCLVDQRLLATDTEGTEPTVEVSHEAVLRHWRELADWIAARRDELVLSERVTTAANDWRKAEGPAKDEALVHRGERLHAAEELLRWHDLGWNEGDYRNAYLAACREAEQRAQAAEADRLRRQRRLHQWIGGLVLITAIVTLLGASLVVTGQRNLGRAQSLMLARTAEHFAQSDDYLRAVRLSILAARENWLMPSSPEGRAALSSSAQGLRLAMEARGHSEGIRGAIFSTDERRILTWSNDGTARLWDSASGAQIGQALNIVSGAVFSKDERRILTWSNDGTTRLWDAASGVQIGPEFKHDEGVRGAVFSKDERRILTWSNDGTARLWNAASGVPIGPQFKHDEAVSGAVFSTDESRILTWSRDGTARLWDAASGAPIGQTVKHEEEVLGAVFSKDEGRILTWSRDSTARLWDATSGAQIGQAFKHKNWVEGAIFSKDERRILTWSQDGTALLWNVGGGAQIGPAFKHDKAVWGAAFSRDERRVLTWSADGTARLWNIASAAQIGPAFKHDKAVRGAVFSKDESRILTWSDDGTARLWDTASGAQIGPMLRHEHWVWGAVFSKDERHILTWSADGTARLWDVVSGRQIGLAFKKDDDITGAIFARNYRRTLTWSRNGTVKLWDVASGAQIGTVLKHDEAVLGAVFSKDERRILTWSADDTARLWDAASEAQIGQAFKHDDTVLGAVFSKDEERILSWSRDGTARLWDVASGAQIGTAFKHDATVEGAVFSRDERRILTWSGDHTARLWDVSSGAQIGPEFKHDGAVLGAIFSRDERRILTWGWDDTARLWDVASGAQIGPPLKHDQMVSGAVFSGDERRILTWGWDDTARMWNVASGAQIGLEFKHDGGVLGAIFSGDERRILTWSNDGTVRLWDVASSAQIGPPIKAHQGVWGVVFFKDEGHILTGSGDGTVRLWDIRWAMREVSDTDFVRDLCREKLAGVSILARQQPSAPEVRMGVRHLDARDTEAAPILRGREGEDVCAPPPTAWDTLMSLLRLPVR